MLDTYLRLLDLCYFEVTEAFLGLADENVWKRPDRGLLSVGELACHIAYGEASRFACDGKVRNLSSCQILSPLLDDRFAYYTTNILTTPTEQQTSLTGKQVLDELLRIHEESMRLLKDLNPPMDTPAPHWDSSYEELLKYLCFHASYHIGQMYSVRHLLREETPNN